MRHPNRSDAAEHFFSLGERRDLRESSGETLYLLLTGEHRLIEAAVVSRELARLNAENQYADSWTTLQLPTRPEDLAPSHFSAVAKLLYERGDWKAAERLFAAISEPAPALVLLHAYTLEHLGREAGDSDILRSGERLLQAHASGAWPTDLEVERRHCQGHIVAGLAELEARLPLVQRARDLLWSAREANAAYTSCWTSLGSELGDHFATVSDSLQVLKHPAMVRGLSHADTMVVLMEVVFYLGHALTACGEYNRALECFHVFDRVMRRQAAKHRPETEPAALIYHDAVGHGRLFTMKAELRRRSLDTMSSGELGTWLAALDGISFMSVSSREMKSERVRMREALVFLDRFLREPPASFADLGAAARQLVPRLTAPTPGRRRATSSLLDGLITLLQGGLPGEPLHVTDASATISLDGIAPALIGASVSTAEEALRLLAALPAGSVAACVLPEPLANLTSDRLHLATSVEELQDIVSVVHGLAAVRSVLDDTDYVFSLVPCVESPATRYQRPVYTQDDLALGASA